jgi:hypothetical protein
MFFSIPSQPSFLRLIEIITYGFSSSLVVQAGTIDENGLILPPTMNLTSERLERHGLFLIEDGQNIFLWIGRDAVPQLVQDVFDLPSYAELPSGKVRPIPFLCTSA